MDTYSDLAEAVRESYLERYVTRANLALAVVRAVKELLEVERYLNRDIDGDLDDWSNRWCDAKEAVERTVIAYDADQ